LLKALLDQWIRRTERDAIVYCDLAIRVRKDNPRVGFDPDLALVEPAPPDAGQLSSLRLWEPGHAVPALVMEVVSPNHPTKDYAETPDQCAALGVRELVVFDPTLAGPKALGGAQRLHVWRRSDAGVFERAHSGDGPFASETLGAFLVLADERRSLRVAEDAAGARLWPTEAEAERAMREAERAMRETERAMTETERTMREDGRAEIETERRLRERAEARVVELEAELAKRGV
jgi:Uma2 family endonuclease